MAPTQQRTAQRRYPLYGMSSALNGRLLVPLSVLLLLLLLFNS